jgi:hypothetical protein
MVPNSADDREFPRNSYENLRIFLREHASEPRAIAHARIAWALLSDECKGHRDIVRASGVADRVVREILPPFGQQDEYGLIRCVFEGKASLDPHEVRRSVYKVIVGSEDPGPKGHTVITSYRNSLSEDGVPTPGLEEREGRQLYRSVSFWTAPSHLGKDRMDRLAPGLDVWKKAGGWLWALAVISWCSDIKTTTRELADWSGMTDRSVRKLVAKWEDDDLLLAGRRDGKIFLLLDSMLMGESNYLDRTIEQRQRARHLDESRLHRQRMTPEGIRAWQVRQAVDGTRQDEDAMYETLKKSQEALSEPQSVCEAPGVPEVPAQAPEPSQRDREYVPAYQGTSPEVEQKIRRLLQV